MLIFERLFIKFYSVDEFDELVRYVKFSIPRDVVAISGRVVDPLGFLTFEPLLLKQGLHLKL